jgi:hypothetical protein
MPKALDQLVIPVQLVPKVQLVLSETPARLDSKVQRVQLVKPV